MPAEVEQAAVVSSKDDRQDSSEKSTSAEDVQVVVAEAATSTKGETTTVAAEDVNEESKDSVSELKKTAVGVRRLSLRMDKKLSINTRSAVKRVSRRDQICHNPAAPDDFRKVARLGEGSVGRVYLVKRHSNVTEDGGVEETVQQKPGSAEDAVYPEVQGSFGTFFAMKVTNKYDILSRNKENRAMTERDIFVTTDHPLICACNWAFQTDKHLYLVLEYCAGGELYTLMKKQDGQRFLEEHAKFYAAEILTALEYLHSLGVVYRDLKPENVLIHDSGHIKLTDFDLASFRPLYELNVSSPTKSEKDHRKLWKDGEATTKPSACASCFACFGLGADYQTAKEVEMAEMRAEKKDDFHKMDFEAHLNAPSRRMNSFVGTAEYIAPEVIMCQGEALEDGYSSTVDWWAFAVLLYEMLFGRTPFKGDRKKPTYERIFDPRFLASFPEESRISPQAVHFLKALLMKEREQRLISPDVMKEHAFFAEIKWALLLEMKPPFVPELPDGPEDLRHFLKVKGKQNDRRCSDSVPWFDVDEGANEEGAEQDANGADGVKVYKGTSANGDLGLTEDLASVDTFEERSKVFTRFDFTFEGSSYRGAQSPKQEARTT